MKYSPKCITLSYFHKFFTGKLTNEKKELEFNFFKNFYNFLKSGINHILNGFDHLIFIVGLLLVSNIPTFSSKQFKIRISRKNYLYFSLLFFFIYFSRKLTCCVYCSFGNGRFFWLIFCSYYRTWSWFHPATLNWERSNVAQFIWNRRRRLASGLEW